MTDIPPIPQQQPAESQPPVVTASLAKPKKNRKAIIITACVIAFFVFCYLVDQYCPDEEAGSNSQQQQNSNATVLSRTFTNTSARGAAREMLGELNRQYGGTVRVLGGMGANDDSQTDVVFSLTKDSQPLCGLIRASRNQNNQCSVTTRLAPAGQMADALAQGNVPQRTDSPAAAQPLTPRQLPDGSGSIHLPAGWNITEANKGAVVATGQNGDMVELGVYTQMYTQASVGGAPPTLVQWGPAQQVFPTATQSFWNFLALAGGPKREFIQLVESRMLENQPNSQKMLAVYDWSMNNKTYRSLGLFIGQPTSPMTWMYYLSSVSAPKSQFAQDLPTLMNIWASRQVDPGVTTARLRDAAAKMSSCADIISDVNANRQRVFDRANDNWTEYFRGQTFVRDAATGDIREVPHEDLNKMVDRQNRQEGYNRFNVIPRRDLEP